MAKNAVLRQIYYDEDGFDSMQVTFNKAKQIIPDITISDVKDWF